MASATADGETSRSYGLQHLEHGLGVRPPRRGLHTQLLPAFGGDGVELRPTIVLGEPPLGANPLLALESVQRLVQCRALDRQYTLRALPDEAGHAVAVH